MKGASYVQRLFDRSGAAEPGGAAAPTGPSASPLANADQRLNEPGFASLFSLIDGPAEPAIDGQSDEPPSRSVGPPRRREADLMRPPPPRLARGEAEPSAAPIAPAAPRAPPALAPDPPSVGRIAAEDFTPADPSPVEVPSSAPEPAVRPVAARPRPEPEPELPAAKPRGEEPAAPPASLTDPPARAAFETQRDPAPPWPAPGAADAVPIVASEPASPIARHEESGGPDEGPPRMAMPPSPSPQPAPTGEAPLPEPTAPPQPRREPPPAKAEAAPARQAERQPPRPLTAAEASLIGPLTPEPRMRSLLGTRWR